MITNHSDRNPEKVSEQECYDERLRPSVVLVSNTRIFADNGRVFSSRGSLSGVQYLHLQSTVETSGSIIWVTGAWRLAAEEESSGIRVHMKSNIGDYKTQHNLSSPVTSEASYREWETGEVVIIFPGEGGQAGMSL